MNGNSQKVNMNVATPETHRCQPQATDLCQPGTPGTGGDEEREGYKGGAGGTCELLETSESYFPLLCLSLCVLEAFPPLKPRHVLTGLCISGTKCCPTGCRLKGATLSRARLPAGGCWPPEVRGRTPRPDLPSKRTGMPWETERAA